MTDLYDIKGYQIIIEISRAVKEKAADGEDIFRCVKILYLGEGKEQADSPECPGDPMAFRSMKSPFRGEINETTAYGVALDENDDLWTSYWNRFLIKDPAIRTEGLRFKYEVTEKLAKKKPDLKMYADGQLLYETRLDQAGTFEVCLNAEEAVKPVREYLEKAHRIGKELLKEFIRVCGKYDLKYYVFCGALLGAVRHKDLIPWDDDVDVAMPREDFDRLAGIAKKEWYGGDYRFFGPEDLREIGFLDYMTRLVYLKEDAGNRLFDRLGEDGEMLRGKAALDIFVLEEAADPPVLHKVQTQLIRGIYGLCLGHRPVTDPEMYTGKRSGEQKAARLLQKTGKHIPLSFLLKWYRHCTRWYRAGRGDSYFTSNGYVTCIPWKFRKEWFGEGRSGSLGDLSVNLPVNAEAYLEQQYGEYQKLPQAYFRVPLHMG